MVSHQQAVFLRSWDLATSALRVFQKKYHEQNNKLPFEILLLLCCTSVCLHQIHQSCLGHGFVTSYLFGHAMSCSFSKNVYATLLALLTLLQHLPSRAKFIPFQFCAPAFSLGTNSPWLIHGDIGYHGTATEMGVVKTTHAAPGGETPQFSHKRSGPKWKRDEMSISPLDSS